ncbi:hypothetical protein K504DRAFT_184771 [Pleomassaria siparia CBS 279.74]|uniref:Uncharacterized protein n=1 Tax=Pleomassaria siparia CBS 279.74 TaxID=1314801 RepID=A0A6G1JS87_9PLEO|nr:hypothetical protein K504DRAFT_184771 [Pleomassaria siparia CBS 279.74]
MGQPPHTNSEHTNRRFLTALIILTVLIVLTHYINGTTESLALTRGRRVQSHADPLSSRSSIFVKAMIHHGVFCNIIITARHLPKSESQTSAREISFAPRILPKSPMHRSCSDFLRLV